MPPTIAPAFDDWQFSSETVRSFSETARSWRKAISRFFEKQYYCSPGLSLIFLSVLNAIKVTSVNLTVYLFSDLVVSGMHAYVLPMVVLNRVKLSTAITSISSNRIIFLLLFVSFVVASSNFTAISGHSDRHLFKYQLNILFSQL